MFLKNAVVSRRESGRVLKRILAVCCCFTLILSGCSEKRTIKKVVQQNGMSKSTANYDFVQAPDDEKKDPAVPKLALGHAVKYFSRDMDDKTIGVYKQIYSGFLKHTEKIDITDGVIHKDDIGALLELCTSASPKISYVSQDYVICVDEENFVTEIDVKYSKTAKQIKTENSELDKKVSEIMEQCPQWGGDYDKVKYFHDVIVRSCEYSEDCENPYSAYGCLCQGQAVCEGYAKAMQILCEKSGILCIPVLGKGVSANEWEPHMWNKIRIDNKWYGFDLTWDDPVCDFGSDYVRYDYFGITDDEMDRDHITDEKKYMKYPEADSLEADYFIQSGLYCYTDDNRYDFVYNSVIKAMSNGEVYAKMKCADVYTYNSLLSEIFTADEEENAAFFEILDRCVAEGYSSYSSADYSLVKDDVMFTVTVKLNLA